MSTRQIHVFISHAWDYSEHYSTLADWIFGETWSVGQASLDFRDFSVPRNDPIHKAANTSQLERAIYDQISRSHVVVIPSGMYANYSKWIQKEINGAKAYKKPVLGVNLWGSERKASVVLSAADDVVGWNKQSLVSKLWGLYYDRNR